MRWKTNELAPSAAYDDLHPRICPDDRPDVRRRQIRRGVHRMALTQVLEPDGELKHEPAVGTGP